MESHTVCFPNPCIEEKYTTYLSALTEKTEENYQDFSGTFNDLRLFQEEFIKNELDDLEEPLRRRTIAEISGYGPLENLINDQFITEIIINSPKDLWIERKGQLIKYKDHFVNKESYISFIERLCEEAQIQFDLKMPLTDGHWQGFRVHIVAPPLTPHFVKLTLRRTADSPWTFEKLINLNWAERDQISFIKDSIQSKKNILFIGPTNSGKTSVLNACLQEVSDSERIVCIEDTDELKLSNSASVKLLTRKVNQNDFHEVDLGRLVKESLRMRPDRLVLGEARGPEAKDLLMALATGHRGSFCTLHADSARQALIRLEMLIQLGAPQWSLSAIRNLILLSIDQIVLVKKAGELRCLWGLYELSSLENTGFCLETLYERKSY